MSPATVTTRLVGWWRQRTLQARLALLVSGAVAVAVVTVAGLAWAAVAEIQQHQLQSELITDAQAIAATPDQWRTGSGVLPGQDGPGPGRRARDLGPRWQIVDPSGAIVSASSPGSLPVTAAARQIAAGVGRQSQENITVNGDTYLMLTVPAAGGGAVQVAINRDPARSTLLALGGLLAAVAAVGIGGAALLGRSVARAGLRPVRQLTSAVETVATTMDLNHPIPVDGEDDIARLGRSVNTMLSAIETARRAQRTLVEDAGHELRTPLTSIRTNVELLLAVERQPELAHRLPPEDRSKLLKDLEGQVAELATLTSELVELAREDTTREQVEPVELSDVVAAAVERARLRAPTVVFTTELSPVALFARPGELERMVVNILDNAGKWSPAGATVHTRLNLDRAGWCELVITDRGTGIDEADRPFVFDRFYRAPSARSMPGSGLGLAIVAQIAAHHGGNVSVTANHPRGTIVTVRLPT